MDRDTVKALVDELRPLIGGRIQRADELDDREICLEIRGPGRTFRLLLTAKEGHPTPILLIERRPPRARSATGLQGSIRRHIVGKALTELAWRDDIVHIEVSGARLLLAPFERPSRLAVEVGVGRAEPAVVADRAFEFPRHAALHQRWLVDSAHARTESLRVSLARPLRAQRKKLLRLVRRLEDDRRRMAALQEEGRCGEVLKSHLSEVTRGQSQVELIDYATGTPIRIDLDPRLSPKANMMRFFSRAKKGTRGLPMVEARVTEVQTKVRAVEADLEKVLAADPDALADLARSPTRVTRAAPTQKKSAVSAIDRCSRAFQSQDGVTIRVGKNASANDELTFRHTRGHHIWLHARGHPGSHVVVYLERGKSLTQAALLDAAHLAAHFSRAKHAGKVEVIYAEARHVRKVRGAPGQVTVAKEKTIQVTIEPERLKRLLGE